MSGDKTSVSKLMCRYYYILMSVSGSSFTKPPLERTTLDKDQFLSFGKITLNLSFTKIPYQRSSLKLKEGAKIIKTWRIFPYI